MDNETESTDRKPVGYLLFALAFVGFMIAAGGVLTGSALPALLGFLILVLVIVVFRFRPSPGE
ncbi:MAG TPA: hypothetical protein VNT26_22075 [Candidatus Sulfotelmatobacter sp.]|nr:hypothetical protein [Candidatus Sulfotelmatobacter sp.]HWI56481.1 hypothetical protein [Bacillota bacterium]